MGLTRTFKGFDEEAFKIGFKKSVGWKEDYTDVDNGDLKEMVCSDIPSYSDESEQIEIKKIGVTKRNPLKYIGAGKGKLTAKQLLNKNYANIFKDLIESSIGKMVLTVDGTGEFEVVSNVTATDKYHLQGVTGTAFDNIYDSTKQVQLVAIYDDSTGKIVDVDTIIANDSTLGIATVAGALSDDIDITGGTVYKVVALSWIDLDEVPDQLLDFLIQRDSGFNFSNNPEFDGIYDGAETVVMKNALGTAKFDLPLGQQPTVEYEFMTDDHNLVDPTPELLPATISVASVSSAVNGTIRLKSKNGTVTDVNFTDGGTNDDNGTAGDIATQINALSDYTATAVNNVVTVTSTNDDLNYTEILIGADAGGYTVSYKDNDNWRAYNEANSIVEPKVLFDASEVGSNTETVTVALSGTPVEGNVHYLIVNGKRYKQKFDEGDDLAGIGTGFLNDINNDVYTLNGTDYREIRYNATYDIATTTLTITATDNSETLDVSFEVEDPSGNSTVSANIQKTVSTDAKGYDEESIFFKLSKIKIGEAGSDMKDFCEVATLSINFARDLKDIKSICSATGRKGWNNTSYTLYFEVETTDIDAERVFDKFYKYKNNKTFALQGVDKDSGFAFFFPACKMESFEKAPQDNLQGHKFTINVNFDPNKKPLLALQQIL